MNQFDFISLKILKYTFYIHRLKTAHNQISYIIQLFRKDVELL